MTNRPLVWKFGLIVVVIGLAVAFSYPPKERINLGLDLKGGVHILLQVQTASAIKFEMDRLQNTLGQRLKDQGLRYEAILPVESGRLEIRGTDPDQRPQMRDELQRFTGGLDVENP